MVAVAVAVFVTVLAAVFVAILLVPVLLVPGLPVPGLSYCWPFLLLVFLVASGWLLAVHGVLSWLRTSQSDLHSLLTHDILLTHVACPGVILIHSLMAHNIFLTHAACRT